MASQKRNWGKYVGVGILVGAGLLAAIGMVVAFFFARHLHRQDQFAGTVSMIDDIRSIVVVATEDGGRVEIDAGGSRVGYYAVGDYIVKIAGETKYAVFREGRQVKAAGMFLERPDDPADYRPKPPAPEPTPEPTPEIAVPPPTERIDALIAEASKQWRAGDAAKALVAAREAQGLCQQHLGANHEKTQQVAKMIQAASAAAPAK